MIEAAAFRTEDLPVADRFGVWCERLADLTAPMVMTSDHAADYRAKARILQLGAAQVWPTALQPIRCRRTPGLVRRSAPELYHLSLVLNGTFDIHQNGEHGVHRRHDLYVVDMSRPFDCGLVGGHRLAGIGMEIPKALLPLPESKVEKLLARRLPGRDGFGALLAGFLTRLSANADGYRPADGPRLGTVLVDLISALFAHALDAEHELPPGTHRRSLTLRIRAFVQQHLHDPQLTVSAVAAAHHISVSYLHRLFETEDVTVAAWIREQRLERARRDLVDPVLRTTPIHEIGRRWGFAHPAAFSRTFRSVHGVSPTVYRRKQFQPGPTTLQSP
ncbi:AraC family transcriptional regulator [Plantactinospora endophytica]|uniref:AraC family transcriptional regulator n=1 Tax=Plantactinospora endophytica TaxID=673535 RepID=A0ABQ4E6R9_9ACTN|nr:AraC family transcriptional regulator [Plantactinospora endophytica]GIG90416.1 AraC family transcriptional regulator [Plantactinospora endophytica]